MSSITAAKLFLTQNKHSFLTFNPSTVATIGRNNEVVCLKVYKNDSSENTFYFSIDSSVQSIHPEIPAVGLSTKYAKLLCLETEDNILISTFPGKINSLQRVWMEPFDENEWEILESKSSQIETRLMDQLRIVQNNHPIVIYIDNIHIKVKITKLEPEDCVFGRLENTTELFIQPKERSITNHPSSSIQRTGSNFISNIFSKISQRSESEDVFVQDFADQVLRVVPFPNDVEGHHLCSFISFNQTKDGIGFVKIKKIHRIDETSNSDFLPTIKVHFSSGVVALPKNRKFIYMSKTLLRTFGLTLGDQVLVKNIASKSALSSTGKLTISTENDDKTEASGLISKLCDSYPIIVPENFVFDLELGSKNTDISLHSAVAPFVAKSKKEFESATWKQKLGQKSLSMKQDFSNSSSFVLEDVDHVFQLMKKSFQFGQVCRVLLQGELGSGKSTALHQVQTFFENNFIFCRLVNCKTLIGKKLETIKAFLVELHSECVYRSPSIVLLDDLDALCRQHQEEQTSHQEKSYLTSLASVFSSVLLDDTFPFGGRSSGNVGVLATISNDDRLHKSLRPSHGNHRFKFTKTLSKPDKIVRLKMLKNFLNEPLLEKWTDSLEACPILTDNFTPKDLKQLANKIKYKLNSGELKSLEDFEVVLTTFKPLSLWGTSLKPSGKRNWKDVGGLKDVKEALTQSLLWPGKYPEIFAQSPIRKRSGILLYGAPGTGKTLLADVVAKECNLNFISIKGPELLSKYIGESEASVRRTFERAQAAKPCLLFFDEFDSLAPRRGHDSTGVTDRVVNQLLTQLDGVDSTYSDAVFVLAATSRPDLIDPALLRPGRLDKAIQCPLPNEVDREEILNCLSQNLKLSNKERDLKVIAGKTNGFTGADLQALLYTAQLAKINDDASPLTSLEVSEIVCRSESRNRNYSFKHAERVWMKEEEKQQEKTGNKLSQASNFLATSTGNECGGLTLDHLLRGLRDTRPSVSRDELDKYSKIYSKFSSNGMKSDNTLGPQEYLGTSTRATLA